MAEKSQQVDRREEALKRIDSAYELGAQNDQDGAIPILLAEAQTLASLAIAEGQDRVAKALEGWVEGRYRQTLVEIAAAAADQGECDDNKVREEVFHLANDLLKADDRA